MFKRNRYSLFFVILYSVILTSNLALAASSLPIELLHHPESSLKIFDFLISFKSDANAKSKPEHKSYYTIQSVSKINGEMTFGDLTSKTYFSTAIQPSATKINGHIFIADVNPKTKKICLQQGLIDTKHVKLNFLSDASLLNG